MPKKFSNDNGKVFYRKSFQCICGYQFVNNNSRLVNKIKKLHKNRCPIGNKATTNYQYINIDYKQNNIVKTEKSLLNK
jgi:hypothetical protein